MFEYKKSKGRNSLKFTCQFTENNVYKDNGQIWTEDKIKKNMKLFMVIHVNKQELQKKLSDHFISYLNIL